MINISKQNLKKIINFAEADYPSECCGLLAGLKKTKNIIQVSRVIPSRNISEGNIKDTFEVDPQVHFNLLRLLNGTEEIIIGHYHSHPNQPATPSETDKSMIYDAELIWLITSVYHGKVFDTRAYAPNQNSSGFKPKNLQVLVDV